MSSMMTKPRLPCTQEMFKSVSHWNCLLPKIFASVTLAPVDITYRK